MIQDDGIVSTGAGTHSPHPLQVTAKSQKRAGGSPNIEPSIGEQKAKCLALPGALPEIRERQQWSRGSAEKDKLQGTRRYFSERVDNVSLSRYSNDC
jgi:hypothetical protein